MSAGGRSAPRSDPGHRRIDGHRVLTRLEKGPGEIAGGLAVSDGLDPVDQYLHHSDGIGDESGATAREIVDQCGRLRANRLGIEDEQVGIQAFGDRPRSCRPKSSAGAWVIMLDGLLQGHQLALP